jgi:formamidopyrimidine-DNA glycosylase
MKKTPLEEVKERFGSKQNLVKELGSLFDKGILFEDRLNPDKGLSHVSNAKLLKLHKAATEVTERFTTRENLVNDLVKIMKREKDEGLKERFEKWGLPRLFAYYETVAGRKS